jgi:hypothetical protein
MIVLEKALSKLYPEIDMVTTPTGKPVAMVHANNCTSDLNAWVGLFHEFTNALGVEISQSKLFEMLYKSALAGDADGGGLLAYNYLSGESITDLTEGRPLFIRTPESRFTPAELYAHTLVLVGGHVEDRHGYSLSGKRKTRPIAGSWRVLQNRRRWSKDHGGSDEHLRLGDGNRG